LCFACLIDAPIKPINTGSGFPGHELNSGWNCTPKKKGCDGISAISTVFSLSLENAVNLKPAFSNKGIY
jgi:hypothetical protein